MSSSMRLMAVTQRGIVASIKIPSRPSFHLMKAVIALLA